MHGHFPWSMFGLHLVKGPKALSIYIFKELDHVIVTMNFDHETRPVDMGKLHGHISKGYIF